MLRIISNFLPHFLQNHSKIGISPTTIEQISGDALNRRHLVSPFFRSVLLSYGARNQTGISSYLGNLRFQNNYLPVIGGKALIQPSIADQS